MITFSKACKSNLLCSTFFVVARPLALYQDNAHTLINYIILKVKVLQYKYHPNWLHESTIKKKKILVLNILNSFNILPATLSRCYVQKNRSKTNVQQFHKTWQQTHCFNPFQTTLSKVVFSNNHFSINKPIKIFIFKGTFSFQRYLRKKVYVHLYNQHTWT